MLGSMQKQRGMTLVMGLIFLVLITLATVASFNLGKNSMEIVGNMQHRNEVTAAANLVLQEAISTTRLFESPATVLLNPCSGQNTRCVDTNGDGTNDVTVSLTPTPTCIQAQTIPNATLDFSNANDAACATGASQVFGIEGVAIGNSLCANSLWEITAVAVDNVTEARITVTEGAAIRVSTDNIAAACP